MLLFIDVSIDICEVLLTYFPITTEKYFPDRPSIDIGDSSSVQSLTLLEGEYTKCYKFIRESIRDRIVERKEYPCITLEGDMEFTFVREEAKESVSQMRKFRIKCRTYQEYTIEEIL